MSYPDDFPIPHVIQPVKVVRHVVKSTIMTSVNSHIGMCWWLICFFGTFLFCWPILFCLCCDASKDIDHNCPNCGLLLATSNRAGF
ncbi:hypothetical protein GCK72_010263 [Caenorhabditis remanei]|uniref:LITAF domain-containing protein n=1 Tax=Caenorhabditis remanei TaxID=31234 RepID=A0A6A5H656_CAERE|nr:hypothetical protein GCK72_010263 [Caenorhabditis remanei]KAF1762003.1 hypothetical protein GCK72_010263 [Caenorhabditis remanei]